MMNSLYRLLLKTGARACRSCGARVVPRAEPAGSVAACPSCGAEMSLLEWLSPAGGTETWDPDAQPPDSKIVRRESGDGSTFWEIPPAGKANGLLIFAIFWIGFVVLWTTAVVVGAVSGDSHAWLLVLFSLPFWLVGAGLLYAALRTKYAKHLLAVTAEDVALICSLFGRVTRRSLPREAVKSVAKKMFYTRNEQPVDGIEIVAGKKKIRFGTGLSEAEKAWLVADLERTLGLGEVAAVAEEEAAGSGGARFSTEIPTARGMGVSILFLVIATAFIAIGIWAIPAGETFRILWLAMSTLFALIGVVSLRLAWRSRGTSVRIIVDGEDLWVIRLKQGREESSERLRRSDVRDVRCFGTGTVNGRPVGRLDLLIAGRTLTLVSWKNQDDLESHAAGLRRALSITREPAQAV